jgi:hypothetical protein
MQFRLHKPRRPDLFPQAAVLHHLAGGAQLFGG